MCVTKQIARKHSKIQIYKLLIAILYQTRTLCLYENTRNMWSGMIANVYVFVCKRHNNNKQHTRFVVVVVTQPAYCLEWYDGAEVIQGIQLSVYYIVVSLCAMMAMMLLYDDRKWICYYNNT